MRVDRSNLAVTCTISFSLSLLKKIRQAKAYRTSDRLKHSLTPYIAKQPENNDEDQDR
jgi:hypothetical protein